MAKKQAKAVAGVFQHLVYSPRGAIDGVLLLVDRKPAQFILEHHDKKSRADLLALEEAQEVVIECSPQGLSGRGRSVHPVFKYRRLLSIDGRKPAKRYKEKIAKKPLFVGIVTRLNFTRHGAPNGVVLDSGDFIHMKPERFSHFKLKSGSEVKAEGTARPLVAGRGCVVEAKKVNGQSVKK